MAVALLYDLADLVPMVEALQAAVAVTSGTDRTALNRILTAIGTPSALPLAPPQYQEGDGDVRVIVLPTQIGTKQQLLDLLDRSWKVAPVTAAFLHAIWKDARSSAVDPWVG
jgi:hypothetical protein